LSYATFSQTEPKASSSSPVHNLNTGLNYTTIQDAINANETLDGQTILVDAGVYNESLLINKSISLKGENKGDTILNATFQFPPPPDYIEAAMVNITASNVEIAGFNLMGEYFNKISTSSCSNIAIKDNIVTSTGTCIALSSGNNCTVANNIIFGGGLEGNNLIVLTSCSGCVIDNNTVLNACYDGISLDSSDHNLIRGNQIHSNGCGVYLAGSNENVIFNNNITGPYSGSGVTFDVGSFANTVFSNIISDCWNLFRMMKCGENTIFHNWFGMSDGDRVYGWDYGNSDYWNFSSEGNYWSDYNGTDANQDGIGDVPYTFPSNNIDYYPLMGASENFTSARAPNYDVQTVSNSTISNFYFNGTAINFDVSGENGTTGFCRICIPMALIGTDYKITVNGTEIQYKLLPNSNSTHSYLYFTYHQSTQEVIITPEFPSFLILPLFMTATLLAVIVYRKKHKAFRKSLEDRERTSL
jgi:parallel beta-helix repeat protein